MKSHLLSLAIAASGLVLLNAAEASGGAEAELLRQSSKAITNFVNACVDGDRNALAATLAPDAALEVPLGDPGTFLLVDGANAAEFCAMGGVPGHVASLHLFPAGGHSVVASFVQGNDRPHLVLVEMRGIHIARLRDFTADSAQVERYVDGQMHNAKDSS